MNILSFFKKTFVKDEKRIGLVLGAGGARGFAYVGILKTLEEKGVKPYCIVGSSAGALIGGMYAAGGSIDDITKLISDLTLKKLAKLFAPTLDRSGLVDTERVGKYIESIVKDFKIENLPIKFACNATDIKTGENIYLKKGSLVNAIRASIAIPGIFKPVKIDSRYLSDGGLNEPLPVKLAYELGANYIIAVNVLKYGEHAEEMSEVNLNKDEKPNIFEMIMSSIAIMQSAMIQHTINSCKIDMLIEPKMSVRVFDFHKGVQAIDAVKYISY